MPPESDPALTVYVCSECGKPFPVGEVVKFCASCGARASSVSKTEEVDVAEKPRVLLVDDSHIARHKIGSILQNLGGIVADAADGEQALKMIDKERPDLLVLDVNMPKITGIDVLEKIRANESLVDLPVVMLTAEADVKIVARAISLKAADYIRKDDPVDQLTQRLKAHIDRSSSRGFGVSGCFTGDWVLYGCHSVVM